MELSENFKNELVDYVLSRISIKRFNAAIHNYSVQQMYAIYKRDLMNDYPELMPTDLRYSVAMSEAFDRYEVDEIRLPKMERKLAKTRKMAVSRCLPSKRKREYREKFNEMVKECNAMLQPQEELIKRYKKIRKKLLETKSYS